VARTILDTGLPEFEQNFRSKVFGLIVLDKLLAARRLDFGLVVSSLSAVLGGLGHMAYAAANAYADVFVLRRNQFGCGTWTTVDWDSWKFERGRVDKVQAILNLLELSIDEDEGATAIELLLSMQAPEQVIVSTGSLRLRVEAWIEQHAVLRSAEPTGQHRRPDVDTPFEEPDGIIEQRLAAIWQEALGLDRVGRNDDFFAIGGHSLLAVAIMSKTRDAFGVDFPLERALEATRLSSAAAVIGELLAAAPAAGAATANESAIEVLGVNADPVADGSGASSADGSGASSADGAGASSADGSGASCADGSGASCADGSGASSADGSRASAADGSGASAADGSGTSAVDGREAQAQAQLDAA
jgi:acyl carrier protein